MQKRENSKSHRVSPFYYWLGYWYIRLMSLFYFPVTVYGRENLPLSGNYIIASNHLSNLDPFLIGVMLNAKYVYVAKDGLFRNQFVGYILSKLGAISLKRDASDHNAIKKIFRVLKDGLSIVLFPEGTRGAGDREKKANPGVGFIALKSGLPIVPVFLRGTDRALPPDKKWFRRHPIEIYVGRPLNEREFEDARAHKDYQLVANQILRQINELPLAFHRVSNGSSMNENNSTQ
ncbi:MAG: 1-acyl-sn-glycerol-3-phosphate acyltransferase [Candidatus Omnitrophica bacterium]|nr:1-acyl-sn-glycerol-3-phosphate acyltransferase [Candidatus Omnitrophota bacterium]